MPDWLYNLLTSSGIYYLVGIWLLICIAWKSKRDALIAKLIALVSERIIFEEDENPEKITFYPRRLFETVAKAFQKAMIMPLDEVIKGLKKWMMGLINLVYNKERPWRTFGYFLFLVLMIVFVLADAIAIANALDVAGWISYELPSILQQYEIAAAMGSLFAIITGVFVFSEINRDRSVFTDWDNIKGAWKQVAKAMAVFLVVFGFVVVFFFGLQRFEALGFLTNTSSSINILVSVVILIIVPLNTVVATALIAEEGFKGFVLILILILAILTGIVHIINYGAYVIGYVLPFSIDIMWRVALFLILLIGYLIVTPIDFIIWILSLPFRMLKTEETSSDTKNRNKK